MKNHRTKITVLFVAMCFVIACHNNQQQETNSIQSTEVATSTGLDTTGFAADSVAILKIFDAMAHSKSFQKELFLDDEDYPYSHFNWSDSRLLRGDLDGDGISDALFPFSIESRGGGNNADFHYALFSKKDGKWLFDGVEDMGGDAGDFNFQLTSIENGIVYGEATPQFEGGLKPYKLAYKYKDKHLVNTYVELHRMPRDEDFASVAISFYGLLNAQLKNIPLQTTMDSLQMLIGKGKKSKISDEECSSFFDDEKGGHFTTKFLTYEYNAQNEVAFIGVDFKGSGITIVTNIGTLDEHTTFDQLKNAYEDSDDWKLMKEEPTIWIYNKDREAESYVFTFDENKQLVSVQLIFQC